MVLAHSQKKSFQKRDSVYGGVWFRNWKADICAEVWGPSSDGLPSIIVLQAHPSSFSPAVKERANTVHPSDTRTNEDQEEPTKSPRRQARLSFSAQTFLRHSSMMQHLDLGKHQRVLECETVFDKAALEYAEQLERPTTLAPVISTVCTRASHTYRQEMG